MNIKELYATLKRHYSGINVPLLWFEAQEKGYGHHMWLTTSRPKNRAGKCEGEKGHARRLYEAASGQRQKI